jgi:hypothetical protein
VRYISSTPSVYALGAADIVSHEKIMGNVLAGSFNEEASMIVMRGEQREMFQASAADRPPALGALYPADTYLAAGEELYAGGARLTEVLRYVVGLSTQDMLRILIVVLIVMRVLGLFEALGIR